MDVGCEHFPGSTSNHPQIPPRRRISCSGTKLARTRPQASRSAIQVASFTSVLRPGTFLICAAFATIRSKAPSLRILQTGFQ
jgi:hypothetical protein